MGTYLATFKSSNYLEHHGVLGQKWGVRRYQNSDGTLTSEGKKRYSKTDRVTDTRDKYGIQKVSYSTDLLKAGTEFGRIANSTDKVDDRRKFLYLTDKNYTGTGRNIGSDEESYEDHWEGLEEDLSSPMKKFTYKATKDIRVRSGEKVVDDLLNKIGDQELSDVVSKMRSYNIMSDYEIDKVSSKEDAAYLENYLSNVSLGKKLNSYYRSHESDLISEYKKKGYDAIVDPVDFIDGVAKYPIIMLDPQSAIEETSRKNF